MRIKNLLHTKIHFMAFLFLLIVILIVRNYSVTITIYEIIFYFVLLTIFIVSGLVFDFIINKTKSKNSVKTLRIIFISLLTIFEVYLLWIIKNFTNLNDL